MRIVRFAAQGKVRYGILKGNVISGLRGSPFVQFRRSRGTFALDGNSYKLEEVRLLAPCSPSKIVCLGLNYRAHAEETKLAIPSVPLIFLKPSTAVISPEDKITLPMFSRNLRIRLNNELISYLDDHPSIDYKVN